MKFATALFALFCTAAAFADTTCFVRNTELVTNDVSMARELCFGDVELQLDVFATSKALVRFSIDNNRAFKTVELKNGRDLGNGTLAFRFTAEANTFGGMCGDTWESDVTATLIVKRDGSFASVEAVKGELSYSIDNCHSGMHPKQTITFDKR